MPWPGGKAHQADLITLSEVERGYDYPDQSIAEHPTAPSGRIQSYE